MRVGRNQIKAARTADLYSYLLTYHADTVQKDGATRLINKEHDSLVITRDKGFFRNSTGEHGNGVDYLITYQGYSFQRAVAALSSWAGDLQVELEPQQPLQQGMIEYPPRATSYQRLYAYLCQHRCIPQDLIDVLRREGLIWQEASHNNLVFDCPDHGIAETCGTLTERRFKGVLPGSDPDGYWAFGAPTGPVYVAESAIDAMSLYAVQRHLKADLPPALYCSLAGVGKVGTLQRIIREHPGREIVLAVDADPAGDKLASKCPELRRIKPKSGCKDWNEWLQLLYGTGKK